MEKRARGSNFTKEEELFLVQTVSKFKNIIECKVTDKVNNQEKNEAWQQVTHQVNANSNFVRTMEQLKMKYDNLKAKLRKVVAQQKSLMTGTGGGPGYKEKLDPVLQCLLQIINKKTVVGLEQPWDSDSQRMLNFTEKELNPCTHEEIAILATPSEIISIEVISEDDNLDGKTESAVDYQSGSEPLLAPSTSKKSTLKRRRTEDETANHSSEDVSVSKMWESYTPRKLKTPMSKKLKQVSNTTLKDRYYEKKIQFAEEEIKMSRLEQEEILIKRKRDDERNEREKEEHRRRMDLLDLEVEMKRRRLYE